ncbi:MAG: hypothetical protein ACTSW3_05660 [Promethearchaeota archaeon]
MKISKDSNRVIHTNGITIIPLRKYIVISDGVIKYEIYTDFIKKYYKRKFLGLKFWDKQIYLKMFAQLIVLKNYEREIEMEIL